MAFIRQSKVRHVYGEPAKKGLRYEGFRCPSTGGSDGSQIAVNQKLIACCTGSGGNGVFIAFPLTKTGRQDFDSHQVTAHPSTITDMAWNPFDDNMLATGCEGGSIKIWNVPDSGIGTKQLLELDYHQKRIAQLIWHPIAKNVLLSISIEPCLTVWNLDDGDQILCLEDSLPSVLFSASFSPDGTKIATSSKDKKLRIYDARSGDMLQECGGHLGGKSQRIFYLSNDRLFTTGFSTMSKRQYAVWNAADMKQLAQESIDSSNATLIPYFHPGLHVLFIAGRGDSVIRYYEIAENEPYIHYITTYQAKEPQRGLAYFPLYAVDASKNEIARFYKLAESAQNKGFIESIQFIVPRKSDSFQEDLYPDTPSNAPALTAGDWKSGSNASPNMFSFADIYLAEMKSKKAARGKGLSGGLGGGGGLGGLKSATMPAASKTAEKKTEAAREPAKAAKATTPSESVRETSKAPAAETPKAAPVTASVDTSKLEAKIDQLKDELKKYAQLEEKVEALEELVKKNNERIAVLESLVQEESDEEGK